jgi:hypothetical protein
MKHHYTPTELDEASIADLLNDAFQCERQAKKGPYYPEKGITKESLLSYAAHCKEAAFKFKSGTAY